ncbi:MAG: OmpH family outer membrane protein [Chlamydiales bacterium]
MKKLPILLLTILFAGGFCKAQARELNLGFVNFKHCLERSKQGQHERNAFEALKNQMTETLEKTNKELEEIAKKLEDQDYMDGLSPTAEDELKQKFQLLSQEFAQYQNQYYQLLNQANYKMLQTMHEEVSLASEKIREKRRLDMILNEDSAFAYSNSLDLTDEVTHEMDRHFELQSKAQAGFLGSDKGSNE